MAQDKTQSKKAWRAATVGSFQKESGIKLNADPKQRLTTYMRKSGMPGMARALRAAEKELAKSR